MNYPVIKDGTRATRLRTILQAIGTGHFHISATQDVALLSGEGHTWEILPEDFNVLAIVAPVRYDARMN